jgi:hypothetical protein
MRWANASPILASVIYLKPVWYRAYFVRVYPSPRTDILFPFAIRTEHGKSFTVLAMSCRNPYPTFPCFVDLTPESFLPRSSRSTGYGMPFALAPNFTFLRASMVDMFSASASRIAAIPAHRTDPSTKGCVTLCDGEVSKTSSGPTSPVDGREVRLNRYASIWQN